ncbi:DUF3575 domain-containing protein [Fluviispira sanaruensis]|uniref:Outer membrane protein beta-barrel domain-containing protein n=1 Tax=Fluviispira sanaruensis TaxID=2493639 RepID=A0A4P2VKL9_FLUSA|nr:DUF3575 domain-containing protein [Fluviispira sanaruensis]BBH53158.1 hypothetical protein JCM31447_16010 [Fluviispira sanaruensis]
MNLLKPIKFVPILFLLFTRNINAQNYFLFEGNGLLFINQGIGLNLEYKDDRLWLSQGIDFEIFAQNPYNKNGVVAKRNIFTIAPKLRYYFIDKQITGPFIGIKIYFTSSESYISDGSSSSEYDVFYVAPTLQIGYRFVTKNNFSFSAYLGGGIKSNDNRFPRDSIPASKLSNSDWIEAQSKMNLNLSQEQFDYGITVGYIY